MKHLKKYRVFFLYFFIFILVSIAAYYISFYLNNSLNNYNEFVGDILNFSSIFSGFLGAVLGILTSMNENSLIMKKIFEIKVAKKQLLQVLLIPFSTGIINIFIAILLRLVLNNQIEQVLFNKLNYIFLHSTLYFCCTGLMMSIIVFVIFFKKNENESKKENRISTR